MIRACIFDLDGVIVDTAKYHFQAWRRLAKLFEIDFTEEANEKLKGISRTESLKRILELADVTLNEKDQQKYCATKNAWYLELIEGMNQMDILPGVYDFLDELKRADIKIGLGSASKNAVTILNKVAIIDKFEVIIDGNGVTQSKPDPEVFLKGAKLLGVPPSKTIVFEDSEKGLMAAKRGKFIAVGIGGNNLVEYADLVVPGFGGINLKGILESIQLQEV